MRTGVGSRCDLRLDVGIHMMHCVCIGLTKKGHIHKPLPVHDSICQNWLGRATLMGRGACWSVGPSGGVSSCPSLLAVYRGSPGSGRKFGGRVARESV